MGLQQIPTPGPYGTQAYIEYFDHLSCGGTPPDGFAFDADWVALEQGGNNIFQIGFIKCKGTAVGCNYLPQSTVAYFVAYGRNGGGPCGAEVLPHPVSLGIAPLGTPLFKVARQAASPYHYEAYIGTTLKSYVYIGDVENCWTGGTPHRDSGVFNEVWDQGFQSGGSVSNKQGYTDVRYQSTYWYPLNRTINAACDYHDRTSQQCHTSSYATDDYFMYDSRFP